MGQVQDLQQALLNASQILSLRSVEQAKYACTIKATIIGVENPGLNLYTVDYCGNQFNVYGQAGLNYQVGDIVYVLIPESDLSQEKMIIGSSAPTANLYVESDPSNVYIPIADELLGTDIEQIDLCSYSKNEEDIPISLSNRVIYNLKKILSDYIKEGKRNIKFSAKVKTEINENYQMKGNYGLKLILPLKRIDKEGQIVYFNYECIMDTTTMSGSPYDYKIWSLQNLYYDMDNSWEFDMNESEEEGRDPALFAFVRDFGYLEDYKESHQEKADIHFRNINLTVVDVLTEEQATGYSLTLVATKGNYFLNNTEYEGTKKITPILKVKGKTESKLKNWKCYWFVEDSSVKAGSKDYLINIGGAGWKCLNAKTYKGSDDTGTPIYEYNDTKYSYDVYKEDIKGSLRYKCVLVQNSVTVEGTILIKNLSKDYQIELVTKNGLTTFIQDVGSINLIARIHIPKEDFENDFGENATLSTSWQRYDKDGNYIEEDVFYTLIRENDFVGDDWYETEISYPCSKLFRMNTVNCTFYCSNPNHEQIYKEKEIKKVIKDNIGSASIVITTSSNFTYKATILNADILYKYDGSGTSPMEAEYDGPISSRLVTINPIDYKVYKANGYELTEDEYLYCHYIWSFPKNSMMKLNIQNDELNQDDNYYYIEGYGKTNSALYYSINKQFDKTKSDNTIFLNVEILDTKENASATVKFLKEGESGTNGTKYSAVIGYQEKVNDNFYLYGEKDSKGIIHKLQCVYVPVIDPQGRVSWVWKRFNSSTNELLDLEQNNEGPIFQVQVYGNGSRVSFNKYTVRWSMFDRRKTNPFLNVQVDPSSGNGILFAENGWDNPDVNSVNIIQAEISIEESSDKKNIKLKETIYAYYPIEITRLTVNQYAFTGIPSLSDGYDQVVYSGSGTTPLYDSKPFKLIDSMKSENHINYYSLSWSKGGNLEDPQPEENNNICNIPPVSKFETGESKNFVKVQLNLSESQEEEINKAKRIAKTNRNKAENEEYAYNTDVLNWVKNFGKSFNYSNYKQILQKYDKILKNRNQCLTQLTDLFFNLSSIKKYLPENNDDNIIPEKVWNLKEDSVSKDLEKQRNIIYLLISSINNFNVLINLKDKYFIDLNDEEINTLNENHYYELLDYIFEWNRLLNKYNVCYNEIINNKNGFINFENEFYKELYNFVKNNTYLNHLVNDLSDINIYHQSYSSLKNQLSCIINYFSQEGSELDSLNIIDELVLQTIYELLETYRDEDYITKIYTEKLNEAKEAYDKYDEEIKGYEEALKLDSSNAIIHIKPIVMLLNRHELSYLDGWDGNKLYTGNKDEYMFAPQMGAGKIEDSSFTGITMGVKNPHSSSKLTGLFGYKEGLQSLFLNADNGSAIFGMSGGGQIILDPAKEDQKVALLYNSGYWNDFNESGLPENYSDDNKSGEGTCIDLSAGTIHFANAFGKIYSGDHIKLDYYNPDTSQEEERPSGFYLSHDGLAIGDTIQIAAAKGGTVKVGRIKQNVKCWTISGNDTNSFIKYGEPGDKNSVYISTNKITLGEKFYVDDTGVVRVGDNAVSSPDNCWTIDSNGNNTNNSNIKYGNNLFESFNLDSKDNCYIGGAENQVYIGTDGIRLGNQFAVDNDGNLVTKHLIANAGGSIGGWTIGKEALVSNDIVIGKDSEGKIKYTGDGIIINSNGNIEAIYEETTEEGKVVVQTAWRIHNGEALFNTITANKEGTIANWVISPNALTANNIEINSNGSIKHTGDKWSINSSGDAEFDDITCTGTIYATGGYVGDTSNEIGTSGFGFSVGTIGLGTASDGNNGISYAKNDKGEFECKIAGNIYANDGHFTGQITANSGTIGGINISTDGNKGIYGGNYWSLTSKGGSIGGWTIGTDSIYSGQGISLKADGNIVTTSIKVSGTASNIKWSTQSSAGDTDLGAELTKIWAAINSKQDKPSS